MHTSHADAADFWYSLYQKLRFRSSTLRPDKGPLFTEHGFGDFTELLFHPRWLVGLAEQMQADGLVARDFTRPVRSFSRAYNPEN